MIFNSTEYIKRELDFQKRLQKKYKALLKELPKGSLFVSNESKQKLYYTKQEMFRGKKKSKYLGTADNPEVQQLQKRYFLEKSIDAITSNIPLMEKFLKEYIPIDPNYLQAQFPKAYQALPETCFDAAGAINLEQWGNAPYNKSTYHKEHLNHITAKGELVRSKSEMNIANALRARGLQYRYEEVMDFNGFKMSPDFRVLDPRENKIVFWEHLGTITEYGYFFKSMTRIFDYMKEGIILGSNLILTYDDPDGNLNSMIIERTIDLWFGPAA